MITIEQFKKMPIGEKIGGGFALSIKTYKKIWQVNNIYYQQVILMDGTGEMPADVKLGTAYNPLRGRVAEIKIIVAEIQEAEYLGKDRKKLYIDQFDFPTQIGEPEMAMNFVNGEPEKIVRGKIKCWLVASMLQSRSVEATLQEIQKPEMKQIIDLIMDG